MSDIPLWYNPPFGPPVEPTISYNSRGEIETNAPFGNKWTFNYSSYLVEGTGNVTVTMPDGRKDIFTSDGNGGFVSPYGVFNTLTYDGEKYVLESLDSRTFVYDIPTDSGLVNPVLVEISDAYDQKLTFGYSSNGQLETITDATTKVTNLIYYSAESGKGGLVQYIQDPFGRSATFDYTDGNLTSVTDMGGYWTTYTYDSEAYLTGIENERGTWGFNIERSNGSGSYYYPAPGTDMGKTYRITATDPLNNKREYFLFGPYSWYVSPRDYITYVNQNTNNYFAPKTIYYLDRTQTKPKITKIVYPEGGYVKYDNLDSNGKPQSITDYHGLDANNNPINHTEHYTYNSKGLITSYEDAIGNPNNTLYIGYYPNNIDVETVTNNLGTITYTYNGDTHDVKTITDRLSILSELSYNTYGQLEKIEEAKGTAIQKTTDLIYAPTSYNLTDIKINSNIITHLTYDTIGRVETQTDATGLTLGYNYNNLDQVTKVLYPDTVYDGTTPISKFVDIVHSSCCPKIIDSTTDRAGLSTIYTHDALKRLTNVQRPDGTYDFQYDPNGNLHKIIDSNRTPAVETTFDYNLDNVLKKKTYTDGKYVEYTPDKMGLVKTFKNARNITKNFTYDANHNLLAMSYSDSTPSVTFTPDDYNRLWKMDDGIGHYEYTYDDNNRLTSVDGPRVDDTITYEYNDLNNLKTLIPQGGETITYGYDYESSDPNIKKIGRLLNIQKGTTDTFTYAYTDVNPLIQTLTRPNGSITEYLYNDPLKRLSDVINKTSTNQVINSFNYSYYTSGSRTDLIMDETITNGETIDNFVDGTTTYTPNTLNQTASSTNPNQSFAYDFDGNMTTGYTPEGYALTMTYDAENRLKTAEHTDNQSVVHRTEYYYSGNSLLAEMKKYQDSVLQSDIRYVRAELLPVQERNENNLISREYTWGLNLGGGIGGLLNLKQNSNDYSYLYDGKGNVTALIGSNQTLDSAYAYDPFGRLMKKSGLLDQPFQFSTKEYDAETGLSYYGYRYYNSAIGKWTTRDPLEEYGDVNLYRMVENNAVNLLDPDGLMSIADAVGGAIEGFQHGVDSGYYGCLAKCMAGGILAPVGAKGLEEVATQMTEHGGAKWIAKKYYSLKYPNWFSAGGKYSKVLVPKLAGYMKLGAKSFSVVGWSMFIYHEYECVKECKKCL